MKHVFSGNAIAEAATAVATNEMDSAAIIKTGDEFHVMPDADTDPAFVYAAIDTATVSAIRAESGPKGPWWVAEGVKSALIKDAQRRKTERGEPRKQSHREYLRVSLGGSDISSVILRDAQGVRELRFGEDGTYSAYLVDAECEVPDCYTLEAECKSWISVYDDDTKTFELQNPGSVIRVYRSGEFGCIIQKM